MLRVTQVAVLEEFNLFLLISDKSLIAYHLDVVCPNERNGPIGANDSARKAPQKLSGSKDVGFFVTGKQKDRTLVFYKKRDNLNSVFKVLEPVYQKSTEKKRGMFKKVSSSPNNTKQNIHLPKSNYTCRSKKFLDGKLCASAGTGTAAKSGMRRHLPSHRYLASLPPHLIICQQLSMLTTNLDHRVLPRVR